MKQIVAIYPGSFDPVTNGHLDLIERGSKLFDQLIVAIARNPEKDTALFDVEERKEMLQAMTVASVRLPPRTSRRAALIARSLSSKKSPEEFVVEERNGEIVVSSAAFRAVYLKSSNQSQIVLKGRSETDDYQLLTRAWQAANNKARELGWIA